MTPQRFKVGWTAFPNKFIDELMPRLRDTEYRVLSVIVRETLGRTDFEGDRRQRAWLSQTLLKRKTGRASAAISRAINVLCLAGIIEIRDGVGRYLHSATARRNYRGRLKYGLSKGIYAQLFANRRSKSELDTKKGLRKKI